MSSSTLAQRSSNIQTAYSHRSGHYETDQFHVDFAQDYIDWAKLCEGDSVLDLACGTGLVSRAAKHAVGPTGYVVGLDFADGMLSVARRLAAESSLEITFVEGDITDLSTISSKITPKTEQGEEKWRGFDLITCCSALVLLRDPLNAIRHWSSLLAPGGLLITDIPTEDTQQVSYIFERMQSSLSSPDLKLSYRDWIQSSDSLSGLLREVGLVPEKVFRTRDYRTREFTLDDANGQFEKWINAPMLASYRPSTTEKMEEARNIFVKEFQALGDKEGKVVDETVLYVGIARKPL